MTDLFTRRPKVSLNLPMAWVALGLRLGSRIKPEWGQIDLDEILRTIDAEAAGRIVEVEHLEEGERIEIFVD
ncbi:MAG TPA: hypothetical protein VJG32_04395 [Anaerolineae bacterium]|nr:hypothetical protein [Anaerolineae bacterium]